jgi:hypothetical protein
MAPTPLQTERPHVYTYLGVAAVPLLYPKSPQPMSSASMNRIDGLLSDTAVEGGAVLTLAVRALLVPTFDAGTVAIKERCTAAISNVLVWGGAILRRRPGNHDVGLPMDDDSLE